MKKVLFVILLLFLFSPIYVEATTKEEIITYVEEKEAIICDKSTKQLFNTYRLLFTRMMKEKELSNTDLETIDKNLKEAVSLIEENDICKKTDLDTLPSSVKTKIKELLYNGMMVIYNAKPIVPSSSKEDNTNGIVVDKNNDTVDIYQDGNLYDKVDLTNKTFNYVGPNPIIMTSFLLLMSFSLLILVTYFLLQKKNWKYHKLVSDICFSSLIVILLALSFLFIEKENINTFLNLSSMLKQPSKNTSIKEIIINENHEILSYPSYGDEYATLHIESLNMHLPIKFGDSKEILTTSLGHSTSSFLPGEGGTILISGHNSTNFLSNLKNITKKSKIQIETKYGLFTYQVDEIKTMNVDQYDEIDISSKEEKLILYTCYPFGGILYGNQRYVVISSLIKEEWRNEE